MAQPTFYYLERKDNYKYVVLLRRNEMYAAKDVVNSYKGQNTDVLVIGIDLASKAKNAEVKTAINAVVNFIEMANPKFIVTGDSNVFKVLTKVTAKAANYAGAGVPLGYADSVNNEPVFALDSSVVYCPSVPQVRARSSLKPLADTSMSYLLDETADFDYEQIIITPANAREIFSKLLTYPEVSVDIETPHVRLNHIYESPQPIISIAFASYTDTESYKGYSALVDRYESIERVQMHIALREFFENYTGKLIFHYGMFDIPVLVSQLYMQHPLDVVGLKRGVEIFENAHDTHIISYHATNSVSGNDLSLKTLAKPLLSNWAAQINVHNLSEESDIDILKYNSDDAVATLWVFRQYYPKLVEDDQLYVYDTVSQPSLALLCEAKLMGMPTSPSATKAAHQQLQAQRDTALKAIQAHPKVKETAIARQREVYALRVKTLKKKIPSWESCQEPFNPSSPPQLSKLLHTIMGLPSFSTTNSGAKATDKAAIKKIRTWAQVSGEPLSTIELLDNIKLYKDAEKLLASFIPATAKGWLREDGFNYLNANFTIGGTISGRLSSSEP